MAAWPSRAPTGSEPKSLIEVSSEHTPINFPSRKDSFILENDLTNTVAASEDFDRLPQRFVASSSQHSAASTVATREQLRLKELTRWKWDS